MLVQGQPRQKVCKTLSQPIAEHHDMSMSGSLSRRIEVQASLGINPRTYLKNNQKQKGLGT
jgi:hypothetical protein